jgi:hypothetical protein
MLQIVVGFSIPHPGEPSQTLESMVVSYGGSQGPEWNVLFFHVSVINAFDVALVFVGRFCSESCHSILPWFCGAAGIKGMMGIRLLKGNYENYQSEINARFVRMSNLFSPRCIFGEGADEISLGEVSFPSGLNGLQSAGSGPSLDGSFTDGDVKILGVEVNGLCAVVVFFNHAWFRFGVLG